MKSGLTHIDVGPELTRTEWESEQTHQLVHGAAFPGAPVERQLFYRSDLHEWYIYDGTAWVSLQAVAQIENHRQTEVHVLAQPPADHDNAAHTPNMATEADLNTHVGDAAAPVHGSTAAAAPGFLVHRDAYGRAKVVDPAVDDDIDTRGARNTGIEDHRLGATHALDQPPADHDNAKHSTHYAPLADLNTHVALDDAHDATAAATPQRIIWRDPWGRARIAAPDHNDDIDNQGARNTAIETHRTNETHSQDQPPLTHGNAKHTTAYASDHDLSTHVGTEAEPVHGSTSAATAEKLIHRDNQGRARVAPPSHADDIDTLGGRITGIGVHKAFEVHDLDQPPESHDNAKHSTNYAPLADFNNHKARHQRGGADELALDILQSLNARPFYHFAGETGEGWSTAVTGSGEVVILPFEAVVRTQTTINSTARLYRTGSSYRLSPLVYTTILWAIHLTDVTDLEAWLVLTRGGVGFPALNDAKVGFHFIDNKVYAHCADGAANTEVEIHTSAAWSLTRFLNRYQPGPAHEFYVNGTLEATITTNIPAHHLYRPMIAITNTDAANKTLNVFAMDIISGT